MVRIYGNRQIKTLPGLQTRPTTARVREALFNRWQHHLQGCHWLDLCAGFGSMGAEALCREAAVVYGIEQAGEACRIIRQNWQSVARPAQTFQVLRGDVVKRLAKLQSQSFDRIYFDPPMMAAYMEQYWMRSQLTISSKPQENSPSNIVPSSNSPFPQHSKSVIQASMATQP